MDGEEPTRNGGLAFGEGNLFTAEIELGVEKVVVTHDEKAVVVKQGKAFPLFGYLIPGEALSREIEIAKVEEQVLFHVLDRLSGIEGFEFRIGLAERVGLVGEGKEIGSAGQVEDTDGFKDGDFGFCRAVLAAVIAFEGEKATIGEAKKIGENEVFGFQLFATFGERSGIGEADGVFGFGGS